MPAPSPPAAAVTHLPSGPTSSSCISTESRSRSEVCTHWSMRRFTEGGCWEGGGQGSMWVRGQLEGSKALQTRELQGTCHVYTCTACVCVRSHTHTRQLLQHTSLVPG